MTAIDSVRVRVASAGDAGVVHALILALADSMSQRERITSSAADIERALSGERPALHALIAEIDGEPAGLVAFFPTFSTWRGTPGVYLQDIYVADTARGKGVGKALLGQVAARAGACGADHLRLSVDRDNASARRFYENLGLAWRDDEMIFEIDGESFSAIGDAP